MNQHPKINILCLGALLSLYGCAGDPTSQEDDLRSAKPEASETVSPSATSAASAHDPAPEQFQLRRDGRVDPPMGVETMEKWPEPEIGHHDLPKHPMTITEGNVELRIGNLTEATSGKKLYVSQWTKEPGYEALDDPEADATVRGRRIAETHDEDFDVAWDSLEDLINGVLVATANNAAYELRSYMISKEEFARIIWPEMPSSRPALQIPADDGWFFLIREAEGAMAVALREYGGQRFKALSVSFDEGVHRYTNFNIYSEMKIYATPTDGSPMVVIDFVRSVVERNGRFKVYTYKD